MSVEECGSDSSEIISAKKRPRVDVDELVSSSSSSEEEEEEENVGEWHDPSTNRPNIVPFAQPSGFVSDNSHIRSDMAIETCYELFAPDKLFEEIAEQTNLYALQQLEGECTQRVAKWTATNKSEIKRLFGLILWMGLVKLPVVNLYWSSDPVYMQTFPKKIMSRNRFELLLRMLHFVDNRNIDGSDRLFKIQPIVDTLERNFQKYYNPTEDVGIEETLIPFRGCIILRQNLKQKRPKYGIKVFKLCCKSGYTYALRVTLEKDNTSPTKIVMSLCRDLFDKGHTLYADNCYTSLELAKKLIDRNIHLVGTLRANQRGNPQQVISRKLRRGQIIAKENERGITILKWKDTRDILVLSTKHSTEMVAVEGRSEHKLKPQIVVDYNRGKAAVDLSDRMNAYNNPPLRRSMKWYTKLAFELLLNTTVLNGYILYKDITKKKNISITEFRKKLVVHLTSCREEDDNIPSSGTATTSKKQRHKLQRKPGKVSAGRKYCKSCYEKNVAECGREVARKTTKRVITFCDTCEGQPFLCLVCFNKIH